MKQKINSSKQLFTKAGNDRQGEMEKEFWTGNEKTRSVSQLAESHAQPNSRFEENPSRCLQLMTRQVQVAAGMSVTAALAVVAVEAVVVVVGDLELKQIPANAVAQEILRAFALQRVREMVRVLVWQIEKPNRAS